MPAANKGFAAMLADGITIGFCTTINYYLADLTYQLLLLSLSSVFDSASVAGLDVIKSQHSSKPRTLVAILIDTLHKQTI